MKQKKLGLALGSGGWRGLAHVGVIKQLIKSGIKIDYIAGSSAGALVGGLYSALQDINQIEQIFRQQMNYRRLLYAFSDPRPKWGIFKGKRIEKIFEKYLKNKSIEDLKTPFCALTCDLLTGQVVEINKGSLSRALRASIAVPFVLEPVLWHKMRLIDGATAVPIPVKTVRQMGAEIVIAVNLQKNQFPMTDHKISSFKTLLKTTQVMLYHLAEHTSRPADLILKPDINENGNYSNPFSGFVSKRETIKDGERVVKKNLNRIKKLVNQ